MGDRQLKPVNANREAKATIIASSSGHLFLGTEAIAFNLKAVFDIIIEAALHGLDQAIWDLEEVKASLENGELFVSVIRGGRAEALDSKLSELSIATFLRALVAIASGNIEKLDRFGEALLPLFFVLISNNGGDFRDQTDGTLSFVLKAIELFCDLCSSFVDE